MDVDGKTVMRAPDGRLFRVDPAKVETVQRDQGWEVAPDEVAQERVQARAQYSKHGSTGQQALGLVETATRSATLGAVKGFGSEDDIRGRANVVAEQSPILNAVAGAAPSVIAGTAAAVATGGTSIPAMMALEGAAGAYGSVGGLTDEAFRRDEELTAEQVFGAIGTGGLLGMAAGGLGGLASKGLGVARNRLVEASARATRKAQARAGEAVGLVNPGPQVFKAVDDPIEAAAIRQAADKARPGAVAQAQGAIDELDTLAATVPRSSGARAIDDAFPAMDDAIRQSPPLRRIIDDLERELPPDSPYRAQTATWKNQISDASDFKATAGQISADLEEIVGQARDPDIAKALTARMDELKTYQASESIFGKQAAESALERQAKIDAVQEARSQLGAKLEGHDYSAVAGTKAGREIEEAAAHYAETIRAADPSLAKAATAAEARLAGISSGPVATGNQIDALLAQPSRKATAANPGAMADVVGEVGETLSEMLVPGAGLLRKAWKYRSHIFNLSTDARGKAQDAASRVLGAVGGPIKAGRRAAGIGAAGYFSNVGGDSDEAKYKQVKATIETLAEEPDRMADALAEQMGDVSTEAPSIQVAVAERAARAVAFLKGKIPPAFEYSMANPDGPPPSRTDMLELSLYWRGVTDPEAVLKAIGDGSAMPEEVEAFKAVYPTWFQEFSESTLDKLQSDAREGKQIGGMRIAQLESLLDLGGQIDPTFGPAVSEIAQQAEALKRAEQSKPKPTGGGQSKAGSRTANKTLESVTP